LVKLLSRDEGNLCYIGCTQAGAQPMAHDPDLEKMRMLAEEGVKALGGYEGILANREHHCERWTMGICGCRWCCGRYDIH